MRQLTQKLKDGRLEVIDVPVPVLSRGYVLVRNAYSVISAGTESSTLRAARKGLIGKAKERPQQARQMIDLLKQAGPFQAYRTLSKKLDSYSSLGYSCTGTIIDVGEEVCNFSIGDKVACAGSRANHSEMVVVPQNLCVKLPAHADLKQAAYNTLGSIALQGIRQADLRLGESCAVIGLGLLGQLSCLLLKAGGNKVIGIDVNPEVVNLARGAIDLASLSGEHGLSEKIDELTGGIGVDAVIITAATKSTDPINFAGQILRKKGRVVVVGDVPTGFDREPYFYQKELDLRMSCSYGPGRYDPIYEEKGIDYPLAYVRWTERRNMEMFQEFVHSRKIDITHLTTHVFGLNDAAKAYELIMGKKEPYLGILIEYDEEPSAAAKVIVNERSSSVGIGKVNIGFIGAGSYAMSHLLPNLPKESWIDRKGVMTASGLSSRSVAKRFNFEFCTSEEETILQNEAINTVFVATRHDSHSHYVIKGLENGKNVFVEKPLCLNEADLDRISGLVNTGRGKKSGNILMVGFNRRFSPLTDFVREKVGVGPMSIIYRINAGRIPADSWIQDKDVGGGRIVGEVCHFIDLVTFLNGSLPEKVQAFCMPDPAGKSDTVCINLNFQNGSIGTICYFANGPKVLPKEYLEVYRAGAVAVLRDFKEVEFFGAGKKAKKRLMFQDKGQARMVNAFINAVKNGDGSPISFEEIFAVTTATFRVLESLNSGSVRCVGVEKNESNSNLPALSN
ncbi:MAG: bi-domain-containing oxidoreductase [Syntrophobacteraceae bacterium]